MRGVTSKMQGRHAEKGGGTHHEQKLGVPISITTTEILVENRPFFEEFVPKFLVAQMISTFPATFFGLIYIELYIIAHKFLGTKVPPGFAIQCSVHMDTVQCWGVRCTWP